MLHSGLEHAPFLFGAVLGVSLAAPPGPMMALLAKEATRAWHRGFLVGVAAMLADVVMFVAVYFGALRLLDHGWVFALLSAAGGVLMLHFARGAWRARHASLDATTGDDTTFAGAFAIAITNPFQITWWATFGLALLAQLGVPVVAGLFAGITAYVALFAAAVRFGAARWDGLPKVVAVVSAVMLAGFGVWSLWRAVGLVA